MADVVLTVNGRQFDGWETVRITRGIEAITGGFELTVSDRWNGQDKPWPIQEEDECTITVDKVTLITGYVDKRSISYGAKAHTLSITGRDRAAALVDCSAVLKNWEFKSVSILALAQKVAAPFGVSVSMDSGINARSISPQVRNSGSSGGPKGAGGAGKTSSSAVPKPPKKFTIDPGESAFEVIERGCRMAGVLPVSDGRGGLLLTRAGNGRATNALVEGENILSASGEFDCSGRYATYIVMAQQQGTDEEYAGAAAHIKGTAKDSNVKRSSRVILIRPDSGASNEQARVRAQWEAKVRAARGDAVSITVQGWTQSDGSLWPVNALVSVKSPMIGVNGEMLITQIEMSKDDQTGTLTHLTLKMPNAYLPEPIVPATGSWKELSKGA